MVNIEHSIPFVHLMNISIGKDGITGHEFLIDSTKHISVEGMSGMGKSTLLVNLFIEHIR